MQLGLKPDIIIACIARGTNVIIPNGQSVIEKGDSVVIVSAERGLNALEDILA